MTRPNGQTATATVQTTEIATISQSDWQVLESVVVDGDLSTLSSEDRMIYYRMRCEAAGLDPRTQPFGFIKVKEKNGDVEVEKLKLYAFKAASDQLTAKRRISTGIIDRQMVSDCYEVTCRATMPDGQQGEDVGVVYVGKLYGNSLANAIMKAVTKAKRRTILAICGLGILDESEIETIPGARVVPQESINTSDVKSLDPPVSSSDPEYAECREWVQKRVDEVNAEVAMTHHVDQYLNLFQVFNALVSMWLKADPPLIREADVLNPKTGKRTNLRIQKVVASAWRNDDESVQDEINAYVKAKVAELGPAKQLATAEAT